MKNLEKSLLLGVGYFIILYAMFHVGRWYEYKQNQKVVVEALATSQTISGGYCLTSFGSQNVKDLFQYGK
jgi:hypothetical protein